MELMQLEMFVALVEEGSVRGAASRVLRTPPAISIAVRKLEEELEMQLLDRSRQMNYRPTAAGRRLYAYAIRIIALRDEALLIKRATTGDTCDSASGEVC
jgi:DNA-binding transcriptional LysR family regulator